MVKIGVRIAGALAVLYVAFGAFLYLFQSSFIFPAPQQVHAPAPGYEAVTLKTQDGLELSAHWRAPDPGKPTVLHFHGNGGSLLGAAAENARLAERGYGLLLVEYRGYGGNPGTPSEVGFAMDGQAGAAFLAAQSIPMSETVVKGHSIGAGTAINIALDFDPAALILVAPFTSVPELSERTAPIYPLTYMVRDPFDNVAKGPKIAAPTLVQHGSADRKIPMAHGQKLAAAIPGAVFERIEGGRHMISVEPDVQASQMAWLDAMGL